MPAASASAKSRKRLVFIPPFLEDAYSAACLGKFVHFTLSTLSGGLLKWDMTKDEALQVFRQTGALLEGHFILRSGLHSRQFFQCALALQEMPVVEKLGAAVADKVRPLGAATVISPAMGGLVIGQEVARQLGVRFIFAEKNDDGKLV